MRNAPVEIGVQTQKVVAKRFSCVRIVVPVFGKLHFTVRMIAVKGAKIRIMRLQKIDMQEERLVFMPSDKIPGFISKKGRFAELQREPGRIFPREYFVPATH